MKKEFKIENVFIILLSVFLLIFVYHIENNKKLEKDILYKEKYEASKLMEKALDEIKNEKINRAIPIDIKYDTNNTGLIGVEFNGITTTLGSLEAKRTSINPNFAAVMVELFNEAGLKEGDKVAVNLSSSFPALNIAILTSCEILNIEPIIITSIGSSTWGGNDLEFTYLDMEEFLFKKGIISNKSKAVSPGGASDIGKDMNKDDLDTILNRMKDYGKEVIIEGRLEKNIELRYNLYNEYSNNIAAFINIGGNIVSFGNTTDSLNTDPGIVEDKTYNLDDEIGLVQLFHSKNIPIIHILNIKDLAHRYGIGIDEKRPFDIGKQDVYYRYKYPIKTIFITTIISILLLIIIGKRKRTDYAKERIQYK